ncbi:hypothetical protein K3152_01940 [Qipengyuania sp. 1NDH17]|jgi:hypothetical protein|uniref:Hydrogenase n=2 Tax=Erythrobacteraceae TaxID=335929 RepID=A0ABS6SQV1_9SPHN|nr:MULTISPECIES: hypothetical protein [Erythrobacteraceae]MEC9067576.1 hypothetical protein [Pseudomonadota bacterium]WBY15434.1 hypothetical protein PF049_07345 [Erythrobacteraceae bacterium WH01K]MBS7671152.1 hypothetical protein [Croceicoccus gelatinilyticus]MBV7267434.1 hypothetical protein [Erythrobacter ani]MBX7456996.1 hypothetical protein [Qipengyuania polymorpha]|tara:strand:- start:1204 stop:1413 length:210 start_codon:yes stop_codon:yes gene_type:complete
MNDPDDTPPGGKEGWEGFREVDRAIAENRLTSYTWKKTWADPWGKLGLILFGVLFLAFLIYVIIYDGLI